MSVCFACFGCANCLAMEFFESCVEHIEFVIFSFDKPGGYFIKFVGSYALIKLPESWLEIPNLQRDKNVNGKSESF